MGDIAQVRFGIKTGANDFFYLEDMIDQLEKEEKISFREIKSQIKNLGNFKSLSEIKRAGLRVCKNHTTEDYWLIESEYLKPVIKSPKECHNILIDPKKLPYKIFLCNDDKAGLNHKLAGKYIEWGEKTEIEIKQGSKKGQKIEGYQNLETIKNRKLWWSLGKPEMSLLHFNYLVFEVGTAYMGEVYASDNFHNIFVDSNYVGVLNSTVFYLFQNIFGRANFGGGLMKIQTFELSSLLIPDIKIKMEDIRPLLTRKMQSVFAECGIDPTSSISIAEQEPEPLPDRAKLDNIIFETLGLNQTERKDVYRALCQLVWNRINKSQSV